MEREEVQPPEIETGVNSNVPGTGVGTAAPTPQAITTPRMTTSAETTARTTGAEPAAA